MRPKNRVTTEQKTSEDTLQSKLPGIAKEKVYLQHLENTGTKLIILQVFTTVGSEDDSKYTAAIW